MSYILDALKKSEQERQRGAVPNLQSIQSPAVPAKRFPRWVSLLSLLLILSAVSLAYWLQAWKKTASDGPAISISEKKVAVPTAPTVRAATTDLKPAIRKPAAQPTKPVPAVAGKPVATIRENPTVAKTRPVIAGSEKPVVQAVKPEMVATKKAASDALPANSVQQWEKIVPSSGSQTIAAKSAPSPQQVTVTSKPQFPTVAELPPAIQRSLPGIRISAHIYSENPSSRMVIINDRTLREGQVVVGGLVLKEITRDGVVFQFQGRRFRMSKLKVWRKN